MKKVTTIIISGMISTSQIATFISIVLLLLQNSNPKLTLDTPRQITSKSVMLHTSVSTSREELAQRESTADTTIEFRRERTWKGLMKTI